MARRERNGLVGRSERRTRGSISLGGARPDPLALPAEDQRIGVSGHHRLARLAEYAASSLALAVAEQLFMLNNRSGFSRCFAGTFPTAEMFSPHPMRRIT